MPLLKFNGPANRVIWNNFLEQVGIDYTSTIEEYNELFNENLVPYNATSYAYSGYVTFASEEDLMYFKLKFS